MDKEVLSKQTEQLVAELLLQLGIQATIMVDTLETENRKYLDIKINSEEAGTALIGHHGKTMEALATVIGMMLPDSEESYGVLLDINEYRTERNKYIEDLAQKALNQVLDTNQSVELLPMKPAERRIVHMTLAGRTDVVTLSEGEGTDRRVIIKPAS